MQFLKYALAQEDAAEEGEPRKGQAGNQAGFGDHPSGRK